MRQAERPGNGNQGEAAFDEEHTGNFMPSGGRCAAICGVNTEEEYRGLRIEASSLVWTRQTISHICANNFLFPWHPSRA